MTDASISSIKHSFLIQKDDSIIHYILLLRYFFMHLEHMLLGYMLHINSDLHPTNVNK